METRAAAGTGGALVVEALRGAGVRVVYGVPGGQTLYVLDAIASAPDLDFVAMRHEMAAVHAADAHFRVTGEPGVCLLTTGPGATHAVSGIGGALRDRSAIVVLTCNNRRELLEEEDAQAADHVAILRPLTKWSTLVADERALARTIRLAFQAATAGAPGPVHVDLPRDLLEARVAPDLAGPQPVPARRRVAPAPEAVEEASRLLLRAQRPLLWVGAGVAQAGASGPVLRLAERLCIPIVTTYSGIGAVPSDHPLVYGPRTRHGTRLTHALLDQADLLFALGMRLSSSSTHRWSCRLPGVLLHNDADEAAIGRHYAPDVALPGDAGLVVEGVLRCVDGSGATPDRGAWLADLERERRDWREHLARARAAGAPGTVHPLALVHEVAGLAPRNTIFAVDAGNPGIWSHVLPVFEPRSYMKPVNYGQMGFALPAAIAARRARPERPVIALIGDGSFGMSVAELETAVRERVAVVAFVLNDGAYNNIRQEQQHLFGPSHEAGVDFADVDYATVARGFGAWACRCASVPELRAAAAEALRETARPAVLDVVLDRDPSVWEEPF